MGARVMQRGVTLTLHALGLFAFVWPFLSSELSREGAGLARSSDAPWLFTILGSFLILATVTEVRAGRMGARQVALLGVLAGVNAILRLPGAFGGASLMFVLPVVVGAVFGARFAFLLGAMSMAASAVITGGIGPWLPFQMWALGWVGAGAGVLRRAVASWRPRATVAALAIYAGIAGLAFGALVNLWFWPFMVGATDVSWASGLGPGETAARYWRFYVLTSAGWDVTRAVANVVLITVVGGPLIRLLTRYRERVLVVWDPAERASEPAGTMVA